MPFINQLYNEITGHVLRARKSMKEQVEALEQDLIERALNDYRGNASHAADHLGLNRTTLVEKMRKYGIKIFCGKVDERHL